MVSQHKTFEVLAAHLSQNTNSVCESCCTGTSSQTKSLPERDIFFPRLNSPNDKISGNSRLMKDCLELQQKVPLVNEAITQSPSFQSFLKDLVENELILPRLAQVDVLQSPTLKRVAEQTGFDANNQLQKNSKN
eukprot:m.63997 g.63997  ORF g.63997 m.63997 type:complete len:134 (-) comp11618_c0_seq2:3396-3797(-)